MAIRAADVSVGILLPGISQTQLQPPWRCYDANNTDTITTYLLTPWSRVPIEKLTVFCS